MLEFCCALVLAFSHCLMLGDCWSDILLKTLVCFIYCCFVFLPDWVLNVAVCRGAGVKMVSGEVKKLNDVSAASDNSHLFKVRG